MKTFFNTLDLSLLYSTSGSVGSNRTFVGHYAGANNTGVSNTFIGRDAGRYVTTGFGNVYVGYRTGSNSNGRYNSFLGHYSGRVNNGIDNIMLGRQAGYFNNSGSRNTMVGSYAGHRGNNGTGNVFIGYKAGFFETGNNQLYIDNSDVSLPLIHGNFDTNRLTFHGSVGINGGNPSGYYKLLVHGPAYANSWLTPSDKRYKKDIQTIDSALDKINALNGVTYSFKQETINNIDFSEQKGKQQIGIIAQQLEKVLPELVKKDEAGYYAVNYDGLVPVLVEAVKEQQDEITDLRTRLEKLESLLNDTETIQGNLSPVNENIDLSGVVLRQNAPNPFSNNTTIEYQLPENVDNASLVISDLTGKIISTYTISEKGTVQFDANGLDSGIYLYAIIANGKSIASQKMVIQK